VHPVTQAFVQAPVQSLAHLAVQSEQVLPEPPLQVPSQYPEHPPVQLVEQEPPQEPPHPPDDE
jgi:hypothetical protein